MKRGFVILILILSVIFWFWFKEFSEIKQFSGNLSEIGSDFIVVKGTFTDSNERPLSKDLSDLKISIASDATIRKIAIKIPDTTEMFLIDSLSKQETIVDLETMKNDFLDNVIGLSILVKKSFLGDYEAKEIIYRIPVFGQ